MYEISLEVMGGISEWIVLDLAVDGAAGQSCTHKLRRFDFG